MSDQRLLSRVAESLYWIGRYVERADGTARIINAYIHRIAENPFNDAESACRSLFAILGARDIALAVGAWKQQHRCFERLSHAKSRSSR